MANAVKHVMAKQPAAVKLIGPSIFRVNRVRPVHMVTCFEAVLNVRFSGLLDETSVSHALLWCVFIKLNSRNPMTDDLTKKRPNDSSRINVHEEWEVTYWCRRLGCTKMQLIAAVTAVGVSAEAVRKHLGK